MRHIEGSMMVADKAVVRCDGGGTDNDRYQFRWRGRYQLRPLCDVTGQSHQLDR
jgi:hypothetical protein